MRRLLIAGLVVLLVAGGYAVADAEDLVPGVLTLSAPPAGSAPTPAPSPTLTWPDGTAGGAAQPVLADASATAPMPVPATLARLLAPTVTALARTGGAEVMDVATGQVLFAHGATAGRTPASTTKLVTAAAVLSSMEPDATLATTVVRGRTTTPAGAGAVPVTQVVLVGGGDTQLATGAGVPTAVFGRAGLADLASATATALAASGVRRVSVGFDDSLFAGPVLSPKWAPEDPRTGEVGPITALGLATRAARPGRAAPADPSLATAQAFVTALRRAGLVVAGTPRRVRAPAGAASLAVVRSAPVRDLLDYTLDTSDNSEAEVLARLAARAAGGVGSFAGAAANDIKALAAMGVPTAGMRLYDGSGLARSDLIPPQTLVALLARAATSERVELRSMFAGLPVAGFTGTLAPRFLDARTRSAAGVVRAKTGTLRGVNTLAGIAVDADGRLLAFAFMADHRTDSTGSARDIVDRAATIVAACGCR